jgi:dihydrofolate reductase
MRSIVLGLGMSVDGYIARPSGAVDFLFMPKDYSMVPFFASIDTALMGRRTFDAALEMGGGSFGSSMATFVFSHSQPPGERNGVVFTNKSPATFVRQLRKRPGKDIWLMGGGELARDFLKADLVDQLYLGIVPVLLGVRHPTLSQRLSSTRFHTHGKQNLLERPDLAQVQTTTPQTETWALGSLLANAQVSSQSGE